MRYEILIAENLTGQNPYTYLDTFDDESISLNYNIADIADIANKNSSYSKTIKLPDTGVNRKAFSDIFNLESISPYWANSRIFDPNKKVKCWVLKDTLIQFVGNIQLTDVVYEYETQNFYYECVIYAENDGLFKTIGDKFLSDLDLSAFDHIWSYNNIVNSWVDNYNRGYYYPLIDYGLAMNLQYLQSGSRNLTNFLPALYVKTLVNQIFAESGFTYKSDFLNTDNFNNLIVPFNNKNLIPSYPDLTYDSNGVICAAGLSNTIDVGANTLGNVDWNNIGFNVDIYDPNNFYNTSTLVYKNGLTASTTQRFTLYLSILMTAGNIATNEHPWQSWSDNIRVWCVRSKFPDGSNVPGWSATPNYYDFVAYPTIVWDNATNIRELRSLIDGGAWEKIDVGNNNYVVRGQISTAYFFPPLRKNEEVRFFITRSVNNQAANPATIVGTSSFFKSEVNLTQAYENAYLQMKNVVPTNVKQKDFLSSIIRMFNLVIEPDKDIQNNFIIEPKDDYYQKYSVFKDWSQKLDLNSEIRTELLSNTQIKTNLFTYKEDKDFYNQKYTETNNKIFGEYKYELDNDFLDGDKKIELIFSPTPINRLTGSQDIYLPLIYQNNNGNITKMDGMNIRILYRKPITLPENQYIKLNGNLQYIYPYAGYVDNPTNPSYSLNFGEINSFYTGYNETQNNLFYNYYQRTIDLLQDRYSKLVTAEINLDAFDINSFRFSDLIYLTIGGMSGYYRVNKIIDYDPSKELPTKVEFITAVNYTNGLSVQVDCPVVLQKCLCGADLTNYLSNVNSYYGTLNDYVTWKSSQDDTYYSFQIPGSTTSAIDIANLFGEIPGATASFTQGGGTCSLNFQVEMGENATLAFLGGLNNYWDNSPEDGGTGPMPYVAIYVNYPCGSTYGVWQEGYNVFFLDLDGYNDQYTFLDLWLNLIPGAYGTASGESLAEFAYLQLGWNWEADCVTASNVNEVYFTITLDTIETQSLVDSVNSAYGTFCDYLVFYNTWAYASWAYQIPNATQSISDIVSWANSNVFGMSASTNDGTTTFYWRQDGVVCDNCNNSYVFKISLSNSDGSPAIVYECENLFVSDVQTNPCILDCFGTGLNLVICYSNVDYLPGGWGPSLFCDGPLLGPTSGPVFDEGGLTYGTNQTLCLCTDDTLCFSWEQTIDCPGGVASLTNYISTAIGEEETLFLWETFDDCECASSISPINYRPELGNTIALPQDVVWVGNLNTNASNTFTDVNNISSGSENFISGSNNLVTGNRNSISGNSNIISGDGNENSSNFVFMMGASLSNTYNSNQPSFLFGNNIQNFSDGSFLIGNNIQIGVGTDSNTISATGSTAGPPPTNLFLVGSDITIPNVTTLPNNTTYLGSENIILDQNGGFNTPFIISEAVSTPQLPTGQTIIKTYTGTTPVILAAFTPPNIYYVFPFTDGTTPNADGTNPISFDDMRDFSVVQIEFNIRVELFGAQAAGDPVASYSNRGAWVKLPNVSGLPDFQLLGTDSPFFVDFPPLTSDISIDIPNTIYDVPLNIAQPSIEITNSSSTDGFVVYYDITCRYQYSPGGFYH